MRRSHTATCVDVEANPQRRRFGSSHINVALQATLENAALRKRNESQWCCGGIQMRVNDVSSVNTVCHGLAVDHFVLVKTNGVCLTRSLLALEQAAIPCESRCRHTNVASGSQRSVSSRHRRSRYRRKRTCAISGGSGRRSRIFQATCFRGIWRPRKRSPP